MAGAIQSSKLEKQRLAPKQNQQDQSKFCYYFVYKAVTVTIFLVILLLLPSQAPEFINQSLLTRIWELLHLLLVGIAISYGLFSRRNDETEKENCSKSDNSNTHLVVSRFLQVSSIFEDEAETSSDETETQVQTWSAQYHRNKPALVVAPQHSNFDHREVTSLQSGEKPLLLPVRSLKSHVSGNRVVQSDNDVSTKASLISRSNPPESILLPQKSLPLGVAVSPRIHSPSNMKIDSVSNHAIIRLTSETSSKSFSSNSNNARIGEIEGCGSPKVEDKMKQNVVLPWRSSLMGQESEFSKMESSSMKSQKSRTSPKLSPSPSFSTSKELSPSPSFSPESLVKNVEDSMKKKGFYKPPPPPPPPPPPTFQKPISMNPRSSSLNKGSSFDKELKRSFKSERHVSFRTDKLMGHASVTLGLSEPPSVELDNMIAGSDEETETEDEDFKKDSGETSKTDKPSCSNSDEGPDVDKKADEFIAKFREQIRLQRIDSIKRSARRILQGNFEDP